MQLKVIGTGSAGNSYLLENDSEALMIECGVRFQHVKIALKFKTSKVVGCIITHEHQDHCKGVKEVVAAGINCYATEGTIKAMGIEGHHRAKAVTKQAPFSVGGFRIIPFGVKHDAADPVGYLINHQETGTVLFLTDTYYCEYTFTGLNNIIVEANYSKEIIDERLRNGDNPEFLRNRVLESHMSLKTCIELLKANDLKAVNNIVLIHLSDSNSNAEEFQKSVTAATGKTVTVAKAGLQLSFNQHPF